MWKLAAVPGSNHNHTNYAFSESHFVLYLIKLQSDADVNASERFITVEGKVLAVKTGFI